MTVSGTIDGHLIDPSLAVGKVGFKSDNHMIAGLPYLLFHGLYLYFFDINKIRVMG
jgi:hypothetical protein